MKTSFTAFFKTSRSSLCRLFLFLMLVFTNVAGYSQEASEAHLKKNLSAIREEQKRLAEEKEMWGYVYMVVGFGVVIAIAWFTTVAARKKAKRDDEERQRLIMKIHGDPHKKGHLHKARR